MFADCELNASMLSFCIHGFSFTVHVWTSLVEGQVFNCTEVDGICLSGTFPDPQSCAHYNYCTQDVWDGCIRIRQQCPLGFAFDRDMLQCTLAMDAVCDGKSSIKFPHWMHPFHSHRNCGSWALP